MIFAGIDIGSTTSKAVIVDDTPEILHFSIADTTFDRNASGCRVLEEALDAAGISRNRIARIIATGYGRRAFSLADEVLPEIVCHARGTAFLHPGVKTVIDIGGQDSKLIELDEFGMVSRFEMNDKCAAGTGRFFEVLTQRLLNCTLDELGPLSLRARDACMISSMCTVFAESEIISFLSEGRTKEDIIAGMHASVARRIVNMGRAAQISFAEPVVFSGGAARNIGMLKEFEALLGKKVTAVDHPQQTAALGAALFARERHSGAADRPAG